MISVVVPVYNSEKYLAECLDSLRAQSYTDLEILLIDDGSTDSSGAICDDYAARDSRFRVVHKPNGGVSSARNTALDIATGEWVMFVDSDDTILPDMAQKLLTLAETQDAQVACCELVMVNPDGSRFPGPTKRAFTCTGREALACMLSSDSIHGYCCNKLISRALIGEHRLCTDLHYAEDTYFLSQFLSDAERVTVTPELLYEYRRHASSATVSAFSDTVFSVIRAFERANDDLRGRFPELADMLDSRIDWAHFMVLDKMIESDLTRSDPRYREMEHWLKSHAGRILKYPALNLKRKLGVTILCVSSRAYRLMTRAYLKRRKFK